MPPLPGSQAAVVHLSLSSTLIGACDTPLVGSQLSVVHALLSLSAGAVPATQFPFPSQLDTPSQTSLLSQLVPFVTKLFTHLPALQLSVVHTFPSAQSGSPVQVGGVPPPPPPPPTLPP